MEAKEGNKRILFILPSLTTGGLEKVQISIANALVNIGYDVTIMALNPAADLLPQLDKRVRYIYKPYKHHPIMKRIPYVRHKFYDDGMWETRAKAKSLYKYYVGDEKYDVEIAFFRGLPIKIISGSTNKKAVKLAWVHNDFRQAQGYKNNFKSLKEVVGAYSGFNKVVCVSNEAKKGFISVIGDTENLETIYNIIPHKELFEKSKEPIYQIVPKANIHAVLVGRLEDKAKGQKRIINVVSKLHNEGYDISLALVGGGNDETTLRDEIDDKNANRYITITGMQKNPYPFMAEADLYICASYYEGFPLTVAEAMILGLPILSTNCTGPNEMLEGGKYGMVVENSEEGLFYGLKSILDNPTILKVMREKTKSRIDFFDEKRIIDKIIGLFA